MAAILSIETSTSVCSAALHLNGNLVAVRENHTPHSTASQLAVQIEELFAETIITRQQIEAVAVSAGPGSYTGLRIGAATAKGLCFGLGVPLIAMDSLLVLASSIDDPSVTDLLCPMIDARRMEVYCSILDSSLRCIEETHARIIDAQSFSDYLDVQSVLFFGNGAAKCREYICHPRAVFRGDIYNSAASMGKLVYQKFLGARFESLEQFEPNYLKEFVAKTKSG